MTTPFAKLALTTPGLARRYLEAIDLPDRPTLPVSDGTADKISRLVAGLQSLPTPKFSMLLRSAADTEAQPATATPTAPSEPVYTDAVDQGFLVGGQIVSFDAQVTPANRAAAVNSCLLAQLHASKLQPNPASAADLAQWHAAYLNVLTNIGWVLQSGVQSEQKIADAGAKVDKALLDLISALIPGGAAIAVVQKIIAGIEKLGNSDPLITLYQSRTVEQNVIEFGASLGSEAASGFLINVVECAVTVQTNHQQVLFFTWDASQADVSGRRYDLSLSEDVYGAISSQVMEKVKPFVQTYVSELSI